MHLSLPGLGTEEQHAMPDSISAPHSTGEDSRRGLDRSLAHPSQRGCGCVGRLALNPSSGTVVPDTLFWATRMVYCRRMRVAKSGLGKGACVGKRAAVRFGARHWLLLFRYQRQRPFRGPWVDRNYLGNRDARLIKSIFYHSVPLPQLCGHPHLPASADVGWLGISRQINHCLKFPFPASHPTKLLGPFRFKLASTLSTPPDCVLWSWYKPLTAAALLHLAREA